MRKLAVLMLACFCTPYLFAAPAVTVSASAVTLLGTTQSISITVTLIDPNATGMLRVSGTGIVPVTVSSTVTPGTTATVGPIYGNDVIIDGFGNLNGTYYKVQVFTVTGGIIASTPSLQNFYAFTGSGTIDLATATPLAPSFMTGTGGSVSMPGSLSVTGTTTFTGATSPKSIETVQFVDAANSQGWAGSDAGAWINAAAAALPAAGGIVDACGLNVASPATITTYIAIPGGVTLRLCGNLTSSNASGFASLASRGSGIESTKQAAAITCTGLTAGSGCLTFLGGASSRGMTIRDIRINTSGAGNCINQNDNVGHVSVERVQCNPVGEGYKIVPGASGCQFINIFMMRVDGATGAAFDFNLGTSTNCTNVQFTEDYASGTLGSGIGYDLQRVQATFNTSGADNGAIGFRFGNTAGFGCLELRSTETQGNTTAGVQVNGTGCFTIVEHFAVGDQVPIQVQSASANTMIINPHTGTTVGANSITYSAASTGHHVCYGCSTGDNLDKAISALGSIVEQHNIGLNTFPSSSAPFVIGNSAASNASTTLELNQGGTTSTFMDFTRGGTQKEQLGNEGTAGNLCTASAQDDLSERLLVGAHNFCNSAANIVAKVTQAGQVNGTTFGSATNCAVNSVSPAACGSAASGAVVVPTTTATYTISTTAVTAASRIFLQPMSFAGNLPSSPTCVVPTTPFITTISAISAATSFTFTLPSTTGQTCWQYWVVN